MDDAADLRPAPPTSGAQPSPARRGDPRRHLYVTWVAYQRRPESMKDRVGYDLRHLPPPFQSKALKPFGYIGQAFATLALVRRERPEVVWFQSPPTMVLHVLVLARLLARLGGRPRFRLVADCHNGVFQEWWRRVPFATSLLDRCDLVLAHNAEVAEIARGLGVSPARLVVLETRPAQVRPGAAAEPPPEAAALLARAAGRPTVLVPCSFDYDEPVELILDLARAAPEAAFLVTGRRRKAEARGVTRDAPANLILTDYLTLEAYNALLVRCDLVLGLTSVEGVQLSAANEAVGAGKAMLLSDTAILRDLFAHAARFAPNDAAAMATALRAALAERPALEALSRELCGLREARWEGQIAAALARIA